MEEKKTRSYEEIMTLMYENAKGFAELKEQQKEMDARIDKLYKVVCKVTKSSGMDDNAESFAELKEQQKESSARIDKRIDKLVKVVCGVTKSNGMMAEECFYNSLKTAKTFGGVHFDVVRRNLHEDLSKDGDNLEGEYDIIMINGDSMCIVETKYRVRPNDVSDLVKSRLKRFKKLFPEYAKYKIYLGIGGMSFERGVKREAKSYGVGILKLKGEVVQIEDKNLKFF